MDLAAMVRLMVEHMGDQKPARLRYFAAHCAGKIGHVRGKPIVFDEIMYEGNLNRRWGNLSGDEMARRFCLGIMALQKRSQSDLSPVASARAPI